jgi:agmatinase
MPNFLGIPDRFSNPDRARFLILPAPYEGTVTYKSGTKDGPAAIIAASQQVELFDEELGFEPYRAGIATLDALEITSEGPQQTVKRVYQGVRTLLRRRQIVILLGGEHSLTTGAVRAYKEKFKDVSVLQLDAHADLRDTYESSPYNHACTLRRVREICPAVQVGIRNLSVEENEFASKEKIKFFYAKDICSTSDWIDEATGKLSRNVYVTIDLDVLDPSFMPAVGTPEPGGLSWYQVLEVLRKTVEEKNVVGFDVMELSPIPEMVAPDFLAAKLVYKMIGYLVAKEKIPGRKVQPKSRR